MVDRCFEGSPRDAERHMERSEDEWRDAMPQKRSPGLSHQEALGMVEKGVREGYSRDWMEYVYGLRDLEGD